MSTTRFVAAAVAASLLIPSIPGVARADEAPAGLRASIDRAVAQLDRQPAPKPAAQRSARGAAKPTPAKAVQPGYGGGGGGKTMMIVTIASTVVGLAATYYVIKQVQEQSKQTPQQ